jgi:hypothetical protein
MNKEHKNNDCMISFDVLVCELLLIVIVGSTPEQMNDIVPTFELTLPGADSM